MRVIDLFAGCGGMSLGFQNAGYDILVAFDKWEEAIEVYRCNFKHPIIHTNLKEIQDTQLFQSYKADMIIGGPPCQDFSSAGKRDETQGRADLTYKFAEIIADAQPQWFVMENVARIRKSFVLKQSQALLKSASYGLTQIVINASLCGVPQNRKRFFLIGHLEGQDDALRPYIEKNLAPEEMTLYDYFGDSLGLEYYYRHPRSYQRRGIFSIYEPSPTIRGVNRPIPKTYKTHKNDAVPVNETLRALSTKERSLIQTFPEDFILEGTKTNLEQMIGNAVPVKQAEFVAKCILEYVKDSADNAVLKHPEQLPLF